MNNFDDFLKQEGILNKCEKVAIERVNKFRKGLNMKWETHTLNIDRNKTTEKEVFKDINGVEIKDSDVLKLDNGMIIQVFYNGNEFYSPFTTKLENGKEISLETPFYRFVRKHKFEIINQQTR